jgi:hypothetical protein
MMLAAQRNLFTGSFNPLSLSPALWLSDTGSNAGQWDDLSGNNRHATQATVANQPAIIQNGLGGRQVRRFDGVDDIMTGSRILTTANFSCYIVVKGAGQQNRNILSQRSTGANIGRTHLCVTDDLTSPYATARLFFNNGTSYSVRSTTPVFNNSFNIFYSQSDGTGNSHVRVNGGLPEGSLTGQNWTPENQPYQLGALSTTANQFAGDIAEILVFPTALSILDRRRVEVYLSQKWGIPIVSDDEFFIQSLSPALWLSDTGSNAGQWDDLSGNGRHATQATTANQPAIVTGALNGRQVRRFDGVNDFLDCNGVASVLAGNDLPISFFIVAKSNVTTGFGRVIGGHSAGTDSHFFRLGNAFRYVRQAGGVGKPADGATANTSYNIHAVVCSGTTATNATNGTVFASNVDVDVPSLSAINSARIGADGAALSNLNGDIAEILVFPTALSTENRRRIEGYLSSKYAIPLS